jgi:hypothetical protein
LSLGVHVPLAVVPISVVLDASEPEVVTDWGAGLNAALRRIFNTVWQGFGYQRSEFYNPDGSRRELDPR